jgi:hypothetical protein
MGSTEIASFNQGAICQFTINGTSDQNQLFVTALVKALNAGYVYLAKNMVGTPVKTAADVASFAQPYIIYSDTTGKYSVGTDANFSNFAISNGMLLFGNFATDANIN